MHADLTKHIIKFNYKEIKSVQINIVRFFGGR